MTKEALPAAPTGLDLNEEFPNPDTFRRMLKNFPFDVLAKRYLVSGLPYIFKDAPLKYISFNEVLARNLDVGHHDVAIVGSARIGFSLSPRSYGEPFAIGSDVDVVVVSPALFSEFQKRVIELIADVPPRGIDLDVLWREGSANAKVELPLEAWKNLKMATEQMRYGFIGPNLLPDHDPLKQRVFNSFNETSTHLLAMNPPGPVSKVRGRIFASWKNAEANYAGSLRALARDMEHARPGREEIEEPEITLLGEDQES